MNHLMSRILALLDLVFHSNYVTTWCIQSAGPTVAERLTLNHDDD